MLVLERPQQYSELGDSMGMTSSAEDRVHAAFADIAKNFYGDFYVPAFAACEFVAACSEESLVILGIDLFHIENESVKPDLARIADFSSLLTSRERWDELVKRAAAEALRFIAEIEAEPSVHLNFTLLSQEDRATSAS